jgi:hypothetical protein
LEFRLREVSDDKKVMGDHTRLVEGLRKIQTDGSSLVTRTIPRPKPFSFEEKHIMYWKGITALRYLDNAEERPKLETATI